MGANEIANHIEAACWVRFGPGTADITPPPLYFRSQNGFKNRIGVVDVADPTSTPTFMIELDRYYTRSETAVFVGTPSTYDLVEIPPSAPIASFTPSAPQLMPSILPCDSRLFYGEIPPPSAPEGVVELFERFNAFFISPLSLTVSEEEELIVEPGYVDICVVLVRIPRGANGPDVVTYKAVQGFTP